MKNDLPSPLGPLDKLLDEPAAVWNKLAVAPHRCLQLIAAVVQPSKWSELLGRKGGPRI